MEIHEHDAGHMTKMAATPIFGKSFLQKLLQPVTWKYVDMLN